LGLAAWFAPTLAGKTSLFTTMANNWLAGAARLETGSVSLGWASPVRLEGVRVLDSRGDEVGVIARAETSLPLWRLLWDRSHFGTVTVQEPALKVVFRDDSSNIEAFLNDLAAVRGSNEAVPTGDVRIVNARAEVRREGAGSAIEVQANEATVRFPADRKKPVLLEAAGHVAEDGRKGTFKVHLTLPPAERSTAPFWAVARVETAGLPLGLAAPFVERVSASTSIAGAATGRIEVSWDPALEPLEVSIVSRMSVEQLIVQSPLTEGDRIEVQRMDLPCEMTLAGTVVDVRSLDVACELGRLSCQGRFDWSDGLDGLLETESLHVTAEVDLARTAATAPRLLRLRNDTQVRSGAAFVELATVRTDAGLTWEGRIELSQLAATSAGQEVQWEQPIEMVYAARRTEDGIVVDRLTAHSTFFQLSGGGTLDRFQAAGRFNLGLMASQLGRIVDLRRWPVGGEAQVRMETVRTDGEGVRLTANVDLSRLVWPEGPWAAALPGEAKVSLTGSAQLAGSTVTSLDRLDLSVQTPRDRVAVNLTEPLPAPDRNSTLVVAATWEGPLATLDSLLDVGSTAPPTWQVSGEANLRATGRASLAKSEIDEVVLQVSGFRAETQGFLVQEPLCVFRSRGTIDRQGALVEFRDCQLDLGTLSARSERIVLPRGGQTASGPGLEAEINGEVERLLACFTTSPLPLGVECHGSLQARISIGRELSGLSAQAKTTIKDLLIRGPEDAALQEPNVELNVNVHFSDAHDDLEIERLELNSLALQGQATGRISGLSGRREMVLDGQLDFDLDQAGRWIRPFFGSGIQLTGKDSRRFSIRGALAAVDVATRPGTLRPGGWNGTFGLGWEWAQVYGFPISAGLLDARMSDGVVDFAPLRVQVSEGEGWALPQIRFGGGTAVLTLPRGASARQVKITPAMCDEALQYIVPALAGISLDPAVTQLADSEGRLSLEIAAGRVPLAHPESADVTGRLTLHSIEVGPGPLVRELGVLMGEARTARFAPQTVVEFQVANGRVYHNSVEIEFPDATVRTSGSVGLDQTLDLMVEMPVPRKWIGDSSLGSALSRRTIRLPVGGTLSKPRIDPRSVEQAAGQFARDTGADLLLQGLNKQLDRLFPPK
jgi:hypothetical protein